jgi:hypothetical protein
MRKLRITKLGETYFIEEWEQLLSKRKGEWVQKLRVNSEETARLQIQKLIDDSKIPLPILKVIEEFEIPDKEIEK